MPVAGREDSQQVLDAAVDAQGKADVGEAPDGSRGASPGAAASPSAEAGAAAAAAGGAASSPMIGTEGSSARAKDGQDASEPQNSGQRDPYSFVRRVPAAADSPHASPRTGGYGWARQKSRQDQALPESPSSNGQLSPRMAAARQAAKLADHIVADAAAADAASSIAAEAAAAVAAAVSAGVVPPERRRHSGSSNGAAAGDDSVDRQSPSQRAVQRLAESTARHAAALDQQRSSANGAAPSTVTASQPDDSNGHFPSSAASTQDIGLRRDSRGHLVRNSSSSRVRSIGMSDKACPIHDSLVCLTLLILV